MKKLLILSIVPIFFFSCLKSDCEPESSSVKLIPASSIKVEIDSANSYRMYSIENGNKILFEYEYVAEQCENVYDDEAYENLRFEFHPDLGDFEFLDSAILQTKCHYEFLSAWYVESNVTITEGIIRGTQKSDREWEILVDIIKPPLFVDEEPVNIVIEGRFGY